MTLFELDYMFHDLGFDTTVTPARNGKVTLAELEYDEIDNYWHFRFRWDDISVPYPPDLLSEDFLAQIDPYAGIGKDGIEIFGGSESSNWHENTPAHEIRAGLQVNLDDFREEMKRIEGLVAGLKL